jgi:predicted permease
MLAVLPTVLPVFLLVAAGWAAARSGRLPPPAVEGLLTFSVRFAVPVLLFGAMVRLDLGRAFDPKLLGAFYGGVALCFALGAVLARRVWRRRPGEAVAVGFAAMFSNTVLLGLPIAERAWGEAVAPAAFAIIALHAPVGYALGIVAMEVSRRDGAGPLETARRTLSEMFSNALALGIGAGLAVNLAGIALPAVAMEAVGLMSDAAIPAALFALGGAMTRHRLRAGVAEAATVSAISLLVHPAAVLGLAALLGLEREQTLAAVTIAAAPVGMNAYLFAAFYRRAETVAAGAMLLATALSAFTVSLWLWLLA